MKQMQQMQVRQQGFTLVELVMVIVIIGILAAVAMPKFFDLTQEAEQAAVDGLAASINTGMTVNFAATKASGGTKGVDVGGCSDASKVLETAIDTAKYTITGGAVSVGGTTTCTVASVSNAAASAKFTAIGADGV